MMELTWSLDALDDLDEIYDIIVEDDEDIAYKFVEEIRGVAQWHRIYVMLRNQVLRSQN